MKTWIVLIIVAILMGLLTVRIIYKKATGMEDEQKWYFKQLNYNFYGRVDRVREEYNRNGWITLHYTGGDFDPEIEGRLKADLKRHGGLRLLHGVGYKRKMFYYPVTDVAAGDSIYINTKEDIIRIFRGDSLVSKRNASVVLTGDAF